MAFINFDSDFAEIFSNMNVKVLKYKKLLQLSRVIWCNNIHTEWDKQVIMFLILVCITSEEGRFSLILYWIDFIIVILIYKPNIVFQVHEC